jgi:hypothetical protein
MRRLILVMVAAIAVLAGASVAGIAWVTGEPPPEPARRGAALVFEADADPEPLVRAPAAPASALAPALAAALAAPPPADTPEPELPYEQPPPLPELPPPPTAPGAAAASLQGRITARCGRMAVRYAPAPAEAVDGMAALVLDLEPLDGEVRVAGSSVRSPGRTRPALVACAQWAVRGLVLPAPGVAGGERTQALLTLGVEER